MSSSWTGGANPPSLPQPCANCGAARTGPFCAACGQPGVVGRMTVRGTLTSAVMDAFDLNRGLLHTAVALARMPGHVVRRYLAGQTVPFMNPVKYFLITVTLAQLLSWWLGVTVAAAEGFTAGYGTTRDSGLTSDVASEFMDRWFVVIVAASVPFLAAATRVAFARDRLNFAEHMVMNLFLAGQMNLGFAVLILLSWPLPASVNPVVQGLYLVLLPVYYSVAAAQLLGRPLASTTLRMIGAFAMAMAASAAALSVLVAIGLVTVA